MSICGSNRFGSVRGTVSLVALCFIAVLGISLASYIAVCSRAMTLSNRSFQANLAKQLAEAGIEEALRAFNKNNWDDWSNAGFAADWSLDTTNRRATATLTFPAGKFGQGTTASVKIRVDNYDAAHLGSTWNSSSVYRIGDLIGYNGIWYRSLRNNNQNRTPGNLTWWVEEPIPSTWSKDVAYSLYDLANYKGIWFRCVKNTIAGTGSDAYVPKLPIPTTASEQYWIPVPTLRSWASSTAYALHDVVVYIDAGTGDYSLHRCVNAHTSGSNFSSQAANWSPDVKALSLQWSSGTVYTRGAVVNHQGAWFYCINSGSNTTAPDADVSMWAPYLDAAGDEVTPSLDTWNAGTQYFAGDYVYKDGLWHRCVGDNADASFDPSATKWDSTGSDTYPFISWCWRKASNSYDFSDVTFYGTSSLAGAWYRCISELSNPSNSRRPSGGSFSSTYWQNALSGSMHAWNSGYSYNSGDAVYHAPTSSWYRCIRANTGQTPSVPSNYWASSPLGSLDWSPNKQYSLNDLVRYGGLWYLSLQSGNYRQNPAAAASSYWAVAPQYLAGWDATREYSPGELVSKDDVWYRCIAPHENQMPPNTSYWSIQTGYGSPYVWTQSSANAAGVYRSYGGIWYRCLITNTGQAPNNATYWAALDAPVLYAEANVIIPNGPPQRAQFRMTIGPEPLFPNAAAATNSLTITGGTGKVDSYDGSAYAIDDNGGYSSYRYDQQSTPFSATPAGNKSYTATLAAGTLLPAGTSTALTVGNGTEVWGYATASSSSASPYAPRFSYGTSANIKGASSAASPNVDGSRVNRSPYIPAFDTLSSSGSFPTGATIPNPSGSNNTLNLGTPGGTARARYFYNGAWDVGTGYDYNTVNINGPVILYINGNVRTRSGGSININSTGSAEIHVSGGIRSNSGSGGYNNRSLDPKKMILISNASSSTTQQLASTSNLLYGVIYVPKTTSSGGLNIATGVTVYGAISAKNITFTSEANLHYDTSLRYAAIPGVDQPYAVTEWRELPVSEQATMP